jgi:hypothetical protein
MPPQSSRGALAVLLSVSLLPACGDSPVAQDDPPNTALAVRLEITPDSVMMVSQNEEVELMAVAYDADGNVTHPERVIWSSRDRNVSRPLTGRDAIRSVNDGSTVVSGTVGLGVTDSVFVTVEVRVAAVVFDAVAITLPALGGNGRPRYTARDANGYLVDGREYRWTTSDSTVVTVAEFDGTLTAIGPGTARVAVEVDGVSDTLDVTVRQVPAEVVDTPPFVYSEALGDIQLDA